MNCEGKQDICELTFSELKAAMTEYSLPSFRASQIYEWLHRHQVSSFGEMTNLPKKLIAELEKAYYVTVMIPAEKLVSRLDGTRKYVFELADGNAIESVLMRYKHGNSVCISSQVGCRMGCRFCASTLEGCVRSLSAAEMLAQVYRIGREIGERISNVVIMGSGEPLDNYEEVLRFVRMLNDPKGAGISARNITISTCGLVPQIYRLAEEGLPVTLALSLHAATQEKREEIMPIAKAYPLPEVMQACREFADRTGRRMSFEYSVVKGVNDKSSDALELASLLHQYGFDDAKGTRGGREGACHVNLIPVNPIAERDYESPDRHTVESFRTILEQKGINATIRREMGRDISSACGQLRRRHIIHAGAGAD